MKFKLIILLAFIGLASGQELVAYQTGALSFSGCNCKGDDKPNPVVFSIFVVNPSSLPMTLSYEWYDPSIGFYREGAPIKCGYTNVLSPDTAHSCTLTVYTMMGGLNGTSNIDVILLGTDGVDNYTKNLDVEVSYHASPFEINLLSRIQSVEQGFNQVMDALDMKCYGSSCCGMLAANDNLSLALDNLSAVNFSLRQCQLSSSWNYLGSASDLIRAAHESLMPLKSNCSAAVSLINDTGLRIASVAKVILEDKKCGSNVTLSESQLNGANLSLSEAVQALTSDDYELAFSKLRDANSSIYSSVNSIEKCPNNVSQKPIVTQPKKNPTNSSSNQTSSGGNSVSMLGEAFVALLILIAAVAIALQFIRKQPKKEEAPKYSPVPPAAPPPQPPAVPTEIHEDLEKEFNEWLESHSKK